MNTYKLDSEKPFNVDQVHSILVEVLKRGISDTMAYHPDECAVKAKSLCTEIAARVKHQEFDRYKLIFLVTIGEKMSYDTFTCVRFLWDSDRDRYATHMYENMHLFVVATVFGLYYE